MNTPLTWVTSLNKIALTAGAIIVFAMAAKLYQNHDEAPPQQHAGRANPWRGLPGCVTLAGRDAPLIIPLDGAATRHCETTGSKSVAIAPPHAIPPGMDTIRLAIDPIRKPPGATTAVQVARGATGASSLIHAGRRIAQGRHAHLTLRADSQTDAQAIADCLTGDAAACGASKLDITPWKVHYEGAAVRMIGLLVMDAYTGRIEALGSSMSHCYRAQHSGVETPAGCPAMPQPAAKRPYRLTNRALFAEAMPASLNKPVLALALLRAPRAHRPEDQELRDMLRRSESTAFLDALFCKNHDYEDCGNTARAATAARDLGWNQGCQLGTACARLFPFNGSTVTSPVSIQGSRILLQPATSNNHAGTWQPIPTRYPATLARECAARQWHRCDGAHFAGLSAEAWGQGNASATPAGIAGMFSRLATAAYAANGKSPPLPHLIEGADSGAGGGQPIDRRHARIILDGLALTHRNGGTAHNACIHVFGQAAPCNQIDWLHGKTGTPVFAHERYTAQMRVAQCRGLAAKIAAHQSSAEGKRRLTALHSHCAMAPYKWYAALVRHGDEAKVVVALVERNYNARTGMVDALNDRGANLAAVAALAWAKQWQQTNNH